MGRRKVRDGRDAILEGTAPDGRAIARAAEIVLAHYGVRNIWTDRISTALAAPTVERTRSPNGGVAVKGTWPHGRSSGLRVTYAGRTYTLGTDRELASDGGGNWALRPASPLPPGSYDVSVTAIGRNGGETSVTVAGVIEIVAPEPAIR